MIWKRFVHKGDYVLSKKAQRMPRFQVQVPVEILQNIGIDICPFVPIEFSAIDVNSRGGKLFIGANVTNEIQLAHIFNL